MIVRPTVRIPGIICLLLVCAGTLARAQESSLTTTNPLTDLYDELVDVLAAADLPFTGEQSRAIVLMMEERQRASEDLFGDLMDYRDGPTRGRDEDRLRSAIAWLRGEFLGRIVNYLTTEQLAEWQRVEEAGGLGSLAPGTAGADVPAETQHVRINNNAFTAEDDQFRRGGRGTEVIPRGGSGAFHGNAQLFLKDDALNARNAFAANKPPYQERQISVDFGGPVVPGWLSTTVFVSQNRSENVDTINASLPGGELFALGITRPQINRNVGVDGVVQLADAHSLRFNVRRQSNTRENQGIGGFRLPERGSDAEFSNWNTNVRQFSTLSSRYLFESALQTNTNRGEVVPALDAVRINVLDAFGSGGSQNASESSARRYGFSGLLTRFGERLTLKVGLAGNYRSERSYSTNNFGGTFTFSSLESYEQGQPIQFSVNQGDPLLDVSQLELSTYVQNDIQLTPRLTVMFGLRYDTQTNLDDHDNVSPRLSAAYAVGRTVIRAGGGWFTNWLDVDLVGSQQRFDGARQREIVIDNPSYPDPFIAGDVRESIPSIRVTDARLEAPRTTVGMVSVERTFFDGLYVTGTYDYQREQNRFRLRNLNAPYDATASVLRSCQPGQPDGTCVRPDPTLGTVLNLESTGSEERHSLRLDARQRFSIFTVSGGYTYQRVHADVFSFSQVATDSYDPDADWARGDDPLHQVNSTVNARLPLGVFLTTQVQARSRGFYTITTGTDDNRDSNVNDRPPGVPRNSAAGPRYFNVNLNLSKAFFVAGGGANLNVFANASNLFNWVHLGRPSGVLTSPSFGRSTSAQNPREIEVGLRFQF
jgi:hypothetical protein